LEQTQAAKHCCKTEICATGKKSSKIAGNKYHIVYLDVIRNASASRFATIIDVNPAWLRGGASVQCLTNATGMTNERENHSLLYATALHQAALTLWRDHKAMGSEK
jgi:hypothetical protein